MKENIKSVVVLTAICLVVAVLLTGYYESKDFGADYPATYIGQDSALGGVDTVAGTTFSSAAFKNAITDAFNVLIENNLVAAGQKSEEQLIGEAMPLALPSSADSLGTCQVTALEGFAAPITQAYKANNGTGYIYVITGSNGTVVAGVNAFGIVKVLDLEGNDVTASEADAAAAAQAANPVIATEALENNTATALSVLAEGAVVTPVEGLNVSGTAIAAFTADVAGETQYVVITAPLGYSNETMKMVTVFDAEGNVIFYKPLTELILHGEYYSAHELTDEVAYIQSFLAVNEGTYSDDMTLVAGATMTANAVADSFNSAFEALKLIKEVA